MAKKRAKKKRQYSDEFKASALAALQANGGDISKTAREFGIPIPTLRNWTGRTERPIPPHIVQLNEQKKDTLREWWDDVVRRAITHLTDDKLEKADAAKLATIAGIGTDKVIALQAQPDAPPSEPQSLDDIEKGARELAEEIDPGEIGSPQSGATDSAEKTAAPEAPVDS